jgi:hypothetical protein
MAERYLNPEARVLELLFDITYNNIEHDYETREGIKERDLKEAFFAGLGTGADSNALIDFYRQGLGLNSPQMDQLAAASLKSLVHNGLVSLTCSNIEGESRYRITKSGKKDAKKLKLMKEGWEHLL